MRSEREWSAINKDARANLDGGIDEELIHVGRPLESDRAYLAGTTLPNLSIVNRDSDFFSVLARTYARKFEGIHSSVVGLTPRVVSHRAQIRDADHGRCILNASVLETRFVNPWIRGFVTVKRSVNRFRAISERFADPLEHSNHRDWLI